MLHPGRFIPIPGEPGTRFDHGAFDPESGRVFVAYTSADALAVLDDAGGCHETTLSGFPEAAGVVVADGTVLVSNRGAASVTEVNARTLVVERTYLTGVRPNGIALAPQRWLARVACLGDAYTPPVLECIALASGDRTALPLPGRPRWCVVDPDEERLFCAIQEPSLVLVVTLTPFRQVHCWALPAAGAHGIDLEGRGHRLFVACDADTLVALDARDGSVQGHWPLPGAPDATWVNPDSGLVHVAVKSPGVVVTIDPATDQSTACPTEVGAGTTALVRPDRLYAFLPERGGALELIEGGAST
jgi:DNA-binding beta-propeller fold protein YncE